mgnify:CR=1 FL=1
MILIGHDHDMTVTKAVNSRVLLAVLESEDLFDVRQLRVFSYLFDGRVCGCEKLL